MKDFFIPRTGRINRLLKDIGLAGEVIWSNKGKCALAFLATVIIPLGSVTAIPIIQKFRELRKEKLEETQVKKSQKIPKKMEPV